MTNSRLDIPWSEDAESRLAVRANGPLTHAEIAELLQCSEQEVIETEARAIEKLRARAPLNPALAELLQAVAAQSRVTLGELVELEAPAEPRVRWFGQLDDEEAA